MKTAIAVGLILSLLATHLWLFVALVRRHGPLRAVAYFFLPVLVPLQAWDAGEKRATLVWCGVFLLYAFSLLAM